MVSQRVHWERVHSERRPEQTSWFEPVPETSLALIEEAALRRDAAVIDVGGGASRLAGELLRLGYTDLTVADISAAALHRAQAELGDAAGRVEWIEADVRAADLGRRYELWHDRAVLHFMVTDADRDAYLATMRASLRPGAHVVIATFGPDGPPRCSGLPVERYDADALSGLLGPGFELVSSRTLDHATPSGASQQFVYALFASRSTGRPAARHA